MTPARLSEIERQLQGVRCLNELAGFRRGLELQGDLNRESEGLVAKRKIELSR